MEARAIARQVRMSPRKVRVVANLVRGKQVGEALGILQHLPKKSAQIIQKVVRSAMANAEDRSGGKVDTDALYIKLIEIDHGTIMKRWLPRAMGRANRVNKRTSHITVVVDES